MSMSDNGVSQDGGGFLVGVQPAQPQPAAVQQPRPDQAVSQPVQVTDFQQPAAGGGRFTEADIERARQQEKEKLYPRLEEMGNQLRALQEERAAEAAERQRLAEEAEAARRAQEEQEMDLRTLMERREQEFQTQISEINKRYDTDRAVFERERALAETQQYRLARIEQEAEFIFPELRDLVQGNTPEEVDQSIEALKLRTEAIYANMQAAQQPVPFRGAAMPSAPAVGPLEQVPSQQQLTPDDIRSMDMDTYKRYRSQLLQATSPRNRGL